MSCGLAQQLGRRKAGPVGSVNVDAVIRTTDSEICATARSVVWQLISERPVVRTVDASPVTAVRRAVADDVGGHKLRCAVPVDHCNGRSSARRSSDSARWAGRIAVVLGTPLG